MMNFVRRRDDVAIQVFSTANEWIDCVFFVSKEDAERAEKVLEEWFEKWWDDEEAHESPYGEWLENAMDRAKIKYDVFYIGGDA